MSAIERLSANSAAELRRSQRPCRPRVDSTAWGGTPRTCSPTAPCTVGKPSISWVGFLGAGLAIASALVLVSAAPVDYWLGILPLRVALLTLLGWGAYGAIAVVVSLIGLVVTLARPREVRRGTSLAAISFLIALVLVGISGRYRLGPTNPPIHDITTDRRDPSEYVAVLPLRVNAPNAAAYFGEGIASRQREASPDPRPLMSNAPPPQAFDRALATVHEMG
jgi:hypothetical protein